MINRLRIVHTINNYIKYIKNDEEMIGEYYLVRRVIINNTPKSWSSDFHKLVVDNKI